jgi:hypothetical protein
MIKNKHNGYSALYTLILLLLLSFVAASAYVVYSKDNKDNNVVTENPDTDEEKLNENTPPTLEQETPLLSFENENFKFSHPANWLVGGQTDIRCLFSPEAKTSPSPTSCEIQKPDGFTSISIRYSGVAYAVKSITDVAVYNGVYFTRTNTTTNGYSAYEFDIKPEVQNGNITGKLVRVAYPDNPDSWVEIDYKYIASSTDYSKVFEEIISSLELLISEDVRGIGG